MMSIIAGVCELLRSRGEPIDGVVLPIFVPVSLRRDRSGQGAGNLISQMIIPVPLGIADPGQRLKRIAMETAKRKAISRPSLGTMFHSRLIRRAMLKLIIRQRVNVVSADLPGPQNPLYFAGARLIEVFPLLNLVGNESPELARCPTRGSSTSWRSATRTPIPTSIPSPRAHARTYAYWLSPTPRSAAGALSLTGRSRARRTAMAHDARMASAAAPTVSPPVTQGRGLRKSGRLSKDITSMRRRVAVPP